MTDVRFDDRVVVITGAGNGLGRTYALEMGKRGAKVVVNDLGGSAFGDGADKGAADLVVDEIKAGGGQAVANYDSVTDGDKIVQTAMDSFGKIDVVINNAGILRDKTFHKMEEQDWDLVYDVHVRGAFKVTHAAWPYMRDQNYGRLIFTASAAGIYGNFGQTNYAMAKLGQYGMSQTLALEGRSKNIMVNTIAPIAGSRLTETVMPQELVDALKPEFIMPLVVKLCDENSQETGGLYEVGAGFIGKVRWERSKGHSFSVSQGFNAEDVNEAWDEIVDFTDADHPSNIAEANKPLIKNLKS
jgi:NAD(P)-dependent dehydrogenase (short-subunit alcohol dehydrogenase family)|tara:strand:- start:569 stop:1468 length:900 start_codon:yes stop_codon:yes gene_type:complete